MTQLRVPPVFVAVAAAPGERALPGRTDRTVDVALRLSPSRRRGVVSFSTFVSASNCAGPNGDVSDETATDRALAAEEEYIETRLEDATCVDG